MTAAAAAESPDSAGQDPGETRADFWSAFSDKPAQSPSPSLTAGATRWDTDLYKSGPTAQPPVQPAETLQPGSPTETALPSAPAAYGQPDYRQPDYGRGSSGQAGYGQGSPELDAYGQRSQAPGSQSQGGYGPPSYGQGSPGPGPFGDPTRQGQYVQPGYQPPPHVEGTISHPLRRSQSAILVVLLVVVLLAVGGGAYLLVSHFTGHKTAAPSRTPTVSAPASTGSTTPATTPSSTGTASPKSSATPTPKTSPNGGLAVSTAAAANTAEPGVAALVNEYFKAINTHDYTAYNSLLAPAEQANDTPSSFSSGYSSTTDLNEKLTAITATGGGGEAATLSFTSHQNASQSPTNTQCTRWTITLYLEPSGGSYLIGHAAPGYHAKFSAC